MKLEAFIDWLCIIVIALMMLVLSSCGGDPKPGTPTPSVSIHAQSPQGISVRIEDGTTPDGALLRKLDADAQRVFDRLTQLGKAGFPTHRGITVKIVSRSAKCEEPALLIQESCSRISNCGAYDGGPYDQDGEVNGFVSLCAAGQYIESTDTILVTRDGVMTGDAFHSEVEHFALRHLDYDRYLRTRDHYGDGSVHPIIK
jgi:hypothetical protein